MGATKTACEYVSEEGVQAKKLQRVYTYFVCFLLGNYPKESIQHTEHDESLKSSIHVLLIDISMTYRKTLPFPRSVQH